MGWIGVDLDGTLAEYEGWKGVDHIGKPIPAMVKRVQDWISLGFEVKIFTARVCRSGEEGKAALTAIQRWCAANIGTVLPVTNKKHFAMTALWDDRCVQVIPNKGESVEKHLSLIASNHEAAMKNAGLTLEFCPVCGGPFYRKKNVKPEKQRKTCSQKCALQHKWANDKPVDMNIPIGGTIPRKDIADLQYHGAILNG